MKIRDSRSVALVSSGARGSATSRRTRVLRIVLLLGCTALAGLPATRADADTEWTGAASSVWGDAGNWSAGVPGAADTVMINTTSPHSTEINNGTAASADLVYWPAAR